MAGNKLKQSSQQDILLVRSREQTLPVLVQHKGLGATQFQNTHLDLFLKHVSHLRLCCSAIRNIYHEKQTNSKAVNNNNNAVNLS